MLVGGRGGRRPAERIAMKYARAVERIIGVTGHEETLEKTYKRGAIN